MMMSFSFKQVIASLSLCLISLSVYAQEKTLSYYNSHESEILPDAQTSFRRGKYERTIELCKWHYIIIGSRDAEALRDKAERCSQLSKEMEELRAQGELKAAKEKADIMLSLNPFDAAAQTVLQIVEPVSGPEIAQLPVESFDPIPVAQKVEEKEEPVVEPAQPQNAMEEPVGVPSSVYSIDTPFRELKKAAQNGDGRAQAILAYKYKTGQGGVKKSLNNAVFWANEASESGDGLGYWINAQIAREKGVPFHVYQHYLYSALKCNYPLAYSFFARVFATGKYGYPCDPEISYNLFLKADEGSSAEASYIVTQKIISGDVANPDKAFSIIKEFARTGNPDAMSALAYMYLFGVGTPIDQNIALSWFNKAADSGSITGRLGLAECSRIGLSTSGNLFEMYKDLASVLPELSSRFNFILGCCYAFGNGCERNAYKATSLWGPLAESGDVLSQAILGISFYEGVSPFYENKRDAFLLLKSAFDNDQWQQLPPILAQKVCKYLSEYYRTGRGVGKNVSYADELLLQAESLLPKATIVQYPFAFLSMISLDEVRNLFQTPEFSEFDEILDQVTFTYPVTTIE